MKGTAILYSAAEREWVKANCALPKRELHAGFVALFGRADVSIDNLKTLRVRNGWLTGRNGCFPKGHVPENKGKPCPEGKSGKHPNARKTQFKKGQTPHNTRELGAEYTCSKDGYVMISIAETNPHTGFERRFVLKHKHLWEVANGPIPEGMCLKSIDGDKTNTDPSNWMLIERSLLPLLNGGPAKRLAYNDAAPELKPTVLALAKLRSAAGKRAKA